MVRGNMRRIQIIGSIDEENYKKFSEALYELEQESDEVVNVELSSEGGSAMDALAFVSRIRLSGCPIHISAYGLVASAATLVLAAGDIREMTREAWVMVHEDHGKSKGSVSDLEKAATHLRRMENQWNNLMESHTKVDAETWARFNKETMYLNPQQCLEMGLIDRIV